MLKKLTLAAAALVVSAAFLGAGSASAATLYKTTAKTTLVPVGTTFTATQPFWDVSKGKQPTTEQLWQQFGPLFLGEVNYCMNSSVTFKVTQNNGVTFKAEPTGAAFPTCNRSQIWSTGTGQELSVTGSSTANGTESAWLGTKFSLRWALTSPESFWYGTFVGAKGSPPANGVFVQQPTAAKAPISINLVKAQMAGLESGWENLSAKLVFTGEAAAWSFG